MADVKGKNNFETMPTIDGTDIIPSGGTAGQVLEKIDGTDYNTQWGDPSPGVTDHTLLTNIGTNTHAQIDTHIADATLHFTQASISITESQISDFGSYIPTSDKGAINGVATLDSGGKIPSTQLPAIAISETFVVASEAAMLALNAQTGDIAIRTDVNQTFILQGTNPAVLGDWQQLLTPTDAVTSVDGRQGVVTLGDLYAPLSHTHAASDVISGTFADARISQSSVTQHQAALTITESQISDLQAYLLNITGESIGDLSDVNVTTPAVRHALMYDGVDSWDNRLLVEADISDLQSYLTAEVNDLTAAVVWANVPDANITQTSVTQHQAALTITESQISDLGAYLTDAPSDGNQYARQDGAWAQVVATGGVSIQGTWKYDNLTGLGDPGTGEFRLNNLNPSLATELYISDECEDGIDFTVIIGALDVGDVIYFQNGEDSTEALFVTVTSLTDNGTWFNIGISVQDNNGTSWTNGKEFGFVFALGVSPRPADLNSLTDVTITTPATNDVLTYTGAGWENQSVFLGAASTVLNTWVLVSGDLYRQDFTHNFGTTDIAVFMYDTVTNKQVLPEDIEIIDSNTIRVFVRGNVETIKVNVVTGSGPQGPQGPQGIPGSEVDKVFRIPHTWAISGDIEVPSGDEDYIIPFFVSFAAGQTASIVKARHRINSGTSVTCKLQKNGVDVTGFTGISVTTTDTSTDPIDVPLADDDDIALVVTGVSGSPQNLTFTIFIEYTQ